jgi:hypothetical protein
MDLCIFWFILFNYSFLVLLILLKILYLIMKILIDIRDIDMIFYGDGIIMLSLG